MISWFEASVLFDELIQNVPDISPAALWDQNGVPVVSSDLRYRHVTSLMVALHVEIKAFVLNSDVLALTVSRRERVSIV